jgi:hypothetical protein
MKRRLAHQLVLLIVAATFGLAVSPSVGTAKPDSKKSPPAAKGPPPGVAVNACGCYRTEAGTCLCGDKKGKCECPGDCEPIGCEAKRAKEVDREIAAETRKAQEDEKKRQAAESAAQAARELPPPSDDATPAGEGDPARGERKPPRKAAKDTQAKTK